MSLSTGLSSRSGRTLYGNVVVADVALRLLDGEGRYSQQSLVEAGDLIE